MNVSWIDQTIKNYKLRSFIAFEINSDRSYIIKMIYIFRTNYDQTEE